VQTRPLNWLVFGAGAIGTYIGGSLDLHGEKVAFLEQPNIAEDLRQRGLHLSINGAELHIPSPRIYGSIEQALASEKYDLIVFAIKSYDTQAVLHGLEAYKEWLPAFLCLQNGVENEAALSALLGAGRVIPGTVTSAISRRAAGDIQLERLRGLGLAAGHALSESAVAALDAAGLNARLYADASSMKWSKLLTNLLANALPAILNLTPSQVLANPALYRLEMMQLREALQVMSAQRIRVTNLPGVPVTLLALAARALPLRLSQPLVQRVAGRGRGQKMPSLHIDLHSGRSLSEVEYLNGAVARFGEQLGVPTPVNQRLNETLRMMVDGEIPLDRYLGKPEKLYEIF
jgi:2-dehydropantoate 2-reductase